MHKTRFAGLTALDPGESILTDGGSVVTRNPEITDHFLEIGARTHRHDASPALADPTVSPQITMFDNGGSLPSNTTFLVGYTLLDDQGGETKISPVALATTKAGLTAPLNPPVTEIDYDAGTLTVGSYYYAVTLVDAAGGETPPSPLAQVTREPGNPNAHIILNDLSTYVDDNPGAVRYRLYRAKDQGKLLLLSEGTQDTIDDDGSLECDCCTEPPAINRSTTGQTSLLTVVVPDTAIGDATAWRLYVTDDGEFYSPSLYGPTRLPAEAGQQITISTLAVDTGAPPDVSTTVAGAAKINPDTDLLNWHWKQPVATAAALPDDSNTQNGDVRMALNDGAIYRYVNGAWTPLTAPAMNFMPPVNTFAALPTLGNANGDVRLALDTHRLYAWSTADNTWHDAIGGDGGGAGTGGHTIKDEGNTLADRTFIDFRGAGVTVTDDNVGNRTVVTIPGSSGGGGGAGGVTFPLAPREEVSWNDLDGYLISRLTVEDGSTATPFYNLDFANEADQDPADYWSDTRSGGPTFKIAGGKLRFTPNAAGYAHVLFPYRNTFGSWRELSVEYTYVIDSADWKSVGVAIMRPQGSNGYGMAVYVTKAGEARLDVSSNDNWSALQSTSGLTPPAIGDVLIAYIGRDRGTLYASVYNRTTGAMLCDYTVPVPNELTTFQGLPTGRVEYDADTALHIATAAAYINSTYYELVAYIGNDRHVLQTTTGVDKWNSAGVQIVFEPDWQSSGFQVRQDLASGEIVMQGALSKVTGAAPVAGELIAKITSPWWYLRDGDLATIAGDSDGREFGILTVVNGTELRWGAGRSTDPATKMPYLSVDGLRR